MVHRQRFWATPKYLAASAKLTSEFASLVNTENEIAKVAQMVQQHCGWCCVLFWNLGDNFSHLTVLAIFRPINVRWTARFI